MTQDRNSKNSSVRLELLLKKLGAFEDVAPIDPGIYAKARMNRMLMEQSLGFSEPLVQAKSVIEKHEVFAGENFNFDIEIANHGQTPVVLDRIENIVPCCGLELSATPIGCYMEGSCLDLNSRTLEPSRVEKIRLKVRALEKGTYAIAPRIALLNGEGIRRTIEMTSEIVTVNEFILPDRVSVGYKDLDNLLFGGLPRSYAVVLNSISCDETMLIINRFLEEGIRKGEPTFLITIDASRWERVAEDFSNFHLFICNPQAETAVKSLPNITKLRGVESLTDISIPIFSTLRNLEESSGKPKRVCIEVLSDILLQHHAAQTRRWLVGLITELKSKEFTTLALMNSRMHSIEEAQAVLDLFDGEIEVSENKSQKTLRIKRMYGQNYITDELELKKERLSTIGTSRRLMYQTF
jgi:KaiC/GvpD/RAD55 family RecA-like ATPase